MLPYLFPDLAAFPTVADLITQLRTSDTRYRAALPAEFCAKNQLPPHVHHPLLHRHPDEAAVVVEVAEATEVAEAAEVAEVAETPVATAAVELLATLRRGVGPVRGRGTGPCTSVLRTGDRTGEQCGGPHSTQRCFGRLTGAWCYQFPEA
ncbi:unnamed protein product [Closterium sp. NIES-65]|nr:unnamed protein product [Closterium sp. NIES-65]